MEKLLRCIICFSRVEDAVLCPHCSMMSCRPCIMKWITEHKACCPHCQQPLLARQLVNGRFLEDISEELRKLQTEKEVSTRDVCPEHDGIALQYFCESCKEAICADCAMFGKKHTGHEFKKLDEVYDAMVALARAEVARVEKRVKSLTGIEQAIDRSIQTVHGNKKMRLGELQSIFTEVYYNMAYEARMKHVELFQKRDDVRRERELLKKVVKEMEGHLDKSRHSRVQIIAKAPQLPRMLRLVHDKPLSRFAAADFDHSLRTSLHEVGAARPDFDEADFEVRRFREQRQRNAVVWSAPLNRNGLVWRLKVYTNERRPYHSEEDGKPRGDDGTHLSVFLELTSVARARPVPAAAAASRLRRMHMRRQRKRPLPLLPMSAGGDDSAGTGGGTGDSDLSESKAADDDVQPPPSTNEDDCGKAAASARRYQYRITLVDRSGAEVASRTAESDFAPGECWGYARFFAIPTVEEDMEALLTRDGSLVLRFAVRPLSYATMSADQTRYIDVLESRDDARKRELQDLKRRYRALKRQAKEGATATGAEAEAAGGSSSTSPPPVKPPAPSDTADGARPPSDGSNDEVEESAATSPSGDGLDEEAEELKGEEFKGEELKDEERAVATENHPSPTRASPSRPSPDVLIRGLAPSDAQDVEDLGAESFDSGTLHISDDDDAASASGDESSRDSFDDFEFSLGESSLLSGHGNGEEPPQPRRSWSLREASSSLASPPVCASEAARSVCATKESDDSVHPSTDDTAADAASSDALTDAPSSASAVRDADVNAPPVDPSMLEDFPSLREVATFLGRQEQHHQQQQQPPSSPSSLPSSTTAASFGSGATNTGGNGSGEANTSALNAAAAEDGGDEKGAGERRREIERQIDAELGADEVLPFGPTRRVHFSSSSSHGGAFNVPPPPAYEDTVAGPPAIRGLMARRRRRQTPADERKSNAATEHRRRDRHSRQQPLPISPFPPTLPPAPAGISELPRWLSPMGGPAGAARRRARWSPPSVRSSVTRSYRGRSARWPWRSVSARSPPSPPFRRVLPSVEAELASVPPLTAAPATRNPFSPPPPPPNSSFFSSRALYARLHSERGAAEEAAEEKLAAGEQPRQLWGTRPAAASAALARTPVGISPFRGGASASDARRQRRRRRTVSPPTPRLARRPRARETELTDMSSVNVVDLTSGSRPSTATRVVVSRSSNTAVFSDATNSALTSSSARESQQQPPPQRADADASSRAPAAPAEGTGEYERRLLRMLMDGRRRRRHAAGDEVKDERDDEKTAASASLVTAAADGRDDHTPLMRVPRRVSRTGDAATASASAASSSLPTATAAATPSAASSSFDRWACRLCTFNNEAARSICEICIAPRQQTQNDEDDDRDPLLGDEFRRLQIRQQSLAPFGDDFPSLPVLSTTPRASANTRASATSAVATSTGSSTTVGALGAGAGGANGEDAVTTRASTANPESSTTTTPGPSRAPPPPPPSGSSVGAAAAAPSSPLSSGIRRRRRPRVRVRAAAAYSSSESLSSSSSSDSDSSEVSDADVTEWRAIARQAVAARRSSATSASRRRRSQRRQTSRTRSGAAQTSTATSMSPVRTAHAPTQTPTRAQTSTGTNTSRVETAQTTTQTPARATATVSTNTARGGNNFNAGGAVRSISSDPEIEEYLASLAETLDIDVNALRNPSPTSPTGSMLCNYGVYSPQPPVTIPDAFSNVDACPHPAQHQDLPEFKSPSPSVVADPRLLGTNPFLFSNSPSDLRSPDESDMFLHKLRSRSPLRTTRRNLDDTFAADSDHHDSDLFAEFLALDGATRRRNSRARTPTDGDANGGAGSNATPREQRSDAQTASGAAGGSATGGGGGSTAAATAASGADLERQYERVMSALFGGDHSTGNSAPRDNGGDTENPAPRGSQRAAGNAESDSASLSVPSIEVPVSAVDAETTTGGCGGAGAGASVVVSPGPIMAAFPRVAPPSTFAAAAAGSVTRSSNGSGGGSGGGRQEATARDASNSVGTALAPRSLNSTADTSAVVEEPENTSRSLRDSTASNGHISSPTSARNARGIESAEARWNMRADAMRADTERWCVEHRASSGSARPSQNYFLNFDDVTSLMSNSSRHSSSTAAGATASAAAAAHRRPSSSTAAGGNATGGGNSTDTNRRSNALQSKRGLVRRMIVPSDQGGRMRASSYDVKDEDQSGARVEAAATAAVSESTENHQSGRKSAHACEVEDCVRGTRALRRARAPSSRNARKPSFAWGQRERSTSRPSERDASQRTSTSHDRSASARDVRLSAAPPSPQSMPPPSPGGHRTGTFTAAVGAPVDAPPSPQVPPSLSGIMSASQASRAPHRTSAGGASGSGGQSPRCSPAAAKRRNRRAGRPHAHVRSPSAQTPSATTGGDDRSTIGPSTPPARVHVLASGVPSRSVFVSSEQSVRDVPGSKADAVVARRVFRDSPNGARHRKSKGKANAKGKASNGRRAHEKTPTANANADRRKLRRAHALREERSQGAHVASVSHASPPPPRKPSPSPRSADCCPTGSNATQASRSDVSAQLSVVSNGGDHTHGPSSVSPRHDASHSGNLAAGAEATVDPRANGHTAASSRSSLGGSPAAAVGSSVEFAFPVVTPDRAAGGDSTDATSVAGASSGGGTSSGDALVQPGCEMTARTGALNALPAPPCEIDADGSGLCASASSLPGDADGPAPAGEAAEVGGGGAIGGAAAAAVGAATVELGHISSPSPSPRASIGHEASD